MSSTESGLMEICRACGGHLNAGIEGHYKSPDERFWHEVCYENDGPPEEPVVDLTTEHPYKTQIPQQYNCGHYAQGPPSELPDDCPECGVGAP